MNVSVVNDEFAFQKKNLKTFVCVNDVFYFNYAPSKSYQSKACQKK